MSSNSPPQEGQFFLLVSFLVLVQLRCILLDRFLSCSLSAPASAASQQSCHEKLVAK